MKENPRIIRHSKKRFNADARNRGPSAVDFVNASGRAATSDLVYQDPAPRYDSAMAATLALHEACAHHWGGINQYCSTAIYLARPFYLFPFELMQHYFSFVFGFQQWVSEPVGTKRMERKQCVSSEHGRHGWSQSQCEETADAMDVAIGASKEMWFELIHEVTGSEQYPDRKQTRRSEQYDREIALTTAA